MDEELEKPWIFIINFGGKRNGPSIDILDAFAQEAGAGIWDYTGACFLAENEHAEQARHALQKTFDAIMQYAVTGIPPRS